MIKDIKTFFTKNELDKLPKTTGVYFFFEKKEPIYIGKAVNIKDRVKNHFFQPSYRDNLFLNKIDKIGFMETNSEIEALVLEANLIKKYLPKFNVVWRDDKNYFYVAVAKNKQNLPYIFITHQKTEKAKFIGPFVEGNALKKALKYLRRVFPFYTAKNHPNNKCQWCHLDLCPGPQPDIKKYKQNIKKLELLLEGKTSLVLRNLKKEMADMAKNQQFEKAGQTRDQVMALESILRHKNIINREKEMSGRYQALVTLEKILDMKNPIERIECYDISNIQGKNATGSMVVFINGVAEKSQYKKFKVQLKNEPNDIAMLKEVLERRFNHPEWLYPQVMLIDGGKAQLNVAIKSKHSITEQKKLKNIKIISIAKGRQELFIEDKQKPISLKSLPQEVYNLIKNLDDEAHRFAITYHKKLRQKNLLQ